MNVPIALDALKRQAGEAIRTNHVARAEEIWHKVIEQAPNDTDALFALGFHAQLKGDTLLAIDRFRRAIEFSPPNPLFRLTVAKALKANGDLDGHFVALSAALEADPYFVPAHLLRAASYIEQGNNGQATQVYRDIFKIVGPISNWPQDLVAQLEIAQAWLVEETRSVTKAYLKALDTLKADNQGADWSRMDEAASILAGASKAYHQEPIMLHVPRLPATPFHSPKDFPWVEALEAQSQLIIDEFKSHLEAAEKLSVPYVAYDPGAPVNQWADLNFSKRWSAVFFYKHGKEQNETSQCFPVTAAILKGLPLADISGFCPNVMFSTLAPKSVIPPHTGETNARLVVHLPLIVPPNCRYRVGYEWREWQVGKPLIFDDSIEHEAINDSDAPRTVLIFDIWNPLLSENECDGVRALLAARAAVLRH